MTKPISTFPGNIESINSLISGTRSSMKIMTDVAGYGKFSAPKQFDEYLETLKALRRGGCTVDMIVYEAEAQRQSSAAQFAPERFEEIKSGRRFHDYFSVHHPELEPMTPRSASEFFDFLANLEEQKRASLTDAGIHLRLLTEYRDLPFFLWLRDDEEAIFSLFYMGTIVTDISFQTDDAPLVATLNQVFDQVLAKAA